MRTLFPFKYLYVGEGSLYVVVVRLKGFRQRENRLPQNGKSFSGERKIACRRLKNRLAQNENPISEGGLERVRTLPLA